MEVVDRAIETSQKTGEISIISTKDLEKAGASFKDTFDHLVEECELWDRFPKYDVFWNSGWLVQLDRPTNV